MARRGRFTFLCDENEREMIAALAVRLRRSRSDAVRFIIVEAAREMRVEATDKAQAITPEVRSENAT